MEGKKERDKKMKGEGWSMVEKDEGKRERIGKTHKEILPSSHIHFHTSTIIVSTKKRK